MIRKILCLVVVFSAQAHADFAWIPDYKKLNLRAAVDISGSSANFDDQAQITDLTYLNRPADFKETAFWIEPEYGLAEDWSVWGRLTFLGASVTDANQNVTLADGSGLGDSRLGIKWGVKPTYPLITLETFMKLPANNAEAASNDILVTSDGALDLGFRIHTGTRAGILLLGLSPGFLARFGGYSSAFTLDAAAQVRFRRAYFRLFTGFIYSVTQTELFDSRLERHDAVGAGGTYARLAGSPTSLNIGGKLGFDVMKNLTLEAAFSHTTYGVRAPHRYLVTLGAMISFDFYQPIKKRRLREIPFEGEEPSGYPTATEEEED